MAKLKALARNPWFWRIVGALLLGLIIWFVGPLIAIAGWKPLGWWPVRLVFALLPILVVGGLWWWRRRQAVRKNAALVDALAPVNAERSELESKLAEALNMLRSTKVGKRGAFVYQLPWYAIIGPSGAGKTTALLNSGLGFPTAVAGEYRALRGQPNTPNCDWWFTDEAVLIDTAGRYVTQDIDAMRDAEGWRGFLDLLKRHRPLQPLNGIIVAIPAPDFADKAKMASHAENIRARLHEITASLGLDLPIYLLVTKADLLAGFREYFARNTDAESEQVFGSTAPGDKSGDEAVLAGFDALVTSVSARVVDRMQNETQLPLRGQIAAFPAQLASLRKPIADLLAALGQKTRYEGAARVRGVYLASGTQTGSPVDRILLNVGVPASASEHAVGRGRSYFLKRFFSDLVFPEQGITGRNVGAEKRARIRYTAGVAGGVAALVVALGLWTYGYVKNMGLIRSVYATAAAYSDAAGLSRGGTATPPEALAALNVLGKATGDMATASDFGLGLGQGGRLHGELDAIYGRDLQRRLTPILANLAESRMVADTNAPSALYDDLKSYLILGGRGPMLPDQILSWVQPAWLASSNEPDAEVQAGDIARHAKALLDGSFQPVAVDAGRIEQARTLLRAQPAAVRVYGRLKTEAMAGGPPMWSARDHAGPQPQIFFAPGGAFAQGAGVPGLFTRSGYDKSFVPIIAGGGKLFDEERWVVGDTGPARSMNPAELSSLKRDLERLYFAEFLSRWQAYLAGMQPRPATSLADNIQRLRDASGPLSPIPPLMKAIAQTTDMTRSAASQGAANSLASGVTGKLLGAAGVDPSAGGADDPRTSVVNAFLPLRMFVGVGAPPGQPAPIDAAMKAMSDLADKLNVVSALAGGGADQGSQASLEVRALVSQLAQTGNSMPAPMNVITKQVSSDAAVALGGARSSQVGAAIGANFGEACTQLVSRSFPVQPAAAADMSVGDFARFFGPQGAFASFVAKDLNGYVDTTKPEWELLPNAAEIGLTPANLRALQAAQTVTRAFFAADPNQPRLVYQIEPVALAGAKSVKLTIDGQSLNFDGKAAVPQTFDWPGAGGAQIEFTVDGSAAPEIRTWPGIWAAFRMMKAAAVKASGSPITGTGSLTQAGARFDFRVRTFGGSNPFVVDPFVKVGCPSTTAATPKAA